MGIKTRITSVAKRSKKGRLALVKNGNGFTTIREDELEQQQICYKMCF